MKDRKLKAALKYHELGLSVIPVLLPGSTCQPELPIFLKQFTWVDLSDGLTNEGVERLVWGITGKKPKAR